jgi:hypothetical protein
VQVVNAGRAPSWLGARRAGSWFFALLFLGHLERLVSHLECGGSLTYLMTAHSFDKASTYSFKMHPVSTTASVDPMMQGVLDSSSDALGADPELLARTTYLHRLLSLPFPLSQPHCPAL